MAIHESWNDTEALEKVDGSFKEHNPLLVLLGVHYTKSNFLVEISYPEGKVEIILEKGKIVECKGIPNLLSSLDVPSVTGLSLGEAMGMAMSKGLRPDRVLDVVEADIGACFIDAALATGKVKVRPYDKPKMKMKLTKSIPQLVYQGVQTSFTDDTLMQFFGVRMRKKVLPAVVDGLNYGQLGLPSRAIRLFRGVKPEQRVQDMLGGMKVTPDWTHYMFLICLGLIKINYEVSKSREPKESPAKEATSKQSGRHKELQKQLDVFSNAEPHVILELQNKRDVNDVVIAEKARALSAKFHPDRYIADGPQAQNLAQRCFERVQEAQQALANEEVRAELKARLEAEERGEKYVSDADRNKASLLYEQAKFLYRKRKFEQSHELFEKCYDLDPYNWRVEYMFLKSSVDVDKMSGLDAGKKILEISGPRAHEKLDVMYSGAELLMLSKDPEAIEQAVGVFKTILDVSPDHSQSKRQLRNHERNRQKAKSEKPEKPKGLFGSFFRRS